MKVHFVAIAGTGMGSLAGLLGSRGWQVSGSDEAVYPPMSTALESWGIPVDEGFSAAHLEARRPDLVVIGNAVRPDNPEAQAALASGVPVLSFPDALYEHAIRGRHSVVVTGTHGKTTTTSLIATLLHQLGRDPSMLVGGITANFGTGFREGSGAEFVVEGDEYDTVFFDKTPKFLHYHPQTLVITSVEFDHADIYRDLAHVEEQFALLVSRMPSEGRIIAAAGVETVDRVVAGAPCEVVRYGFTPEAPAAEYLAANLETDQAGTRFDVQHRGELVAKARLAMVGRHNVENALAGLAVVHGRGVPLSAAVAALAAFRGVKRRQEVRGVAAGVLVIDDFAHHPTAVRGTLEALADQHRGRRLVAVFEPRSNTSRRAIFQQAYARAFDAADYVVISSVSEDPIYSATGTVTERLSADRLARDLEARGGRAVACADVPAIVAHLLEVLESGDVVVTLSNGGFGGIWDKLLLGLEVRGV